jgi:hypothetical protein
VTILYDWNEDFSLDTLKVAPWLLPEKSQYGVYRVFSHTSIRRCGGCDPTGTLYIGSGGGRKKRGEEKKFRPWPAPGLVDTRLS